MRRNIVPAVFNSAALFSAGLFCNVQMGTRERYFDARHIQSRFADNAKNGYRKTRNVNVRDIILGIWHTIGTQKRKSKHLSLLFRFCKLLKIKKKFEYTRHDSNMRPLDS